ncbi:hypothetical protein MHYP_G00000170 [Metynnis hypsauchen]
MATVQPPMFCVNVMDLLRSECSGPAAVYLRTVQECVAAAPQVRAQAGQSLRLGRRGSCWADIGQLARCSELSLTPSISRSETPLRVNSSRR